jgi:hypothetical protein
MSECNEGNEPQESTRGALTTARRFALVAENALANGDLRRARAALRNLLDATVSGGMLADRDLRA